MLKHMKIVSSLASLTLFFAVGSSYAQQPDSSTTRTSSDKSSRGKSSQMAKDSKLSSTDKGFAMKAAMGGMTEVQLGQMATQKASSEDVKKFGQRMVDDHSKANEELKAWASGKGVTLPSGPDAKQKSMMDRLSKLSGADFDREYMKAMVKDHKEDISLFERQASSGRDTELKSFAGKTLPTLREHQTMANDVATKVGASSMSNKAAMKGTK